MKTKKIFICTLALIIVTFACSKNDLDTTSTRQLASTYYSYDDHLENAIIGAYSSLQLETSRWGANGWLWGSIASDDNFAGGGSNTDQPGYQNTDTHTITPSDPTNLLNLWTTYFQGINSCDLILTYVKPDDDLKKQTIAQAQFLSGFYYFYLARMFGGLPLIPNVLAPTDQVKRSTLDQTFTFIENILIQCINGSMQERTNVADPANGLATKASAQALLGKVYLYHAAYIKEDGTRAINKQYYTSAITYLSAVANNPNYSLDPIGFWHIFNPTTRHGVEFIFEVNFTRLQAAGLQGDPLSTLCGPRTVANQQINDTIHYGWGFNAPSQELVDLFKSENDMVRYNASIFDTASLQKWHDLWAGKHNVLNWDIDTPKEAEGGFFDRKHYADPHTFSAWNGNDNPQIYLRLADVYLMLAEAYNQTGDDANALKYLNLVRARVGRVAAGSSGDALFQDIKKERHLELASEGDRYFDLVRWGDASSVLVGNAAENISSYDDGTPGKNTNGLFPIPLGEISRTSGPNALTQNPGY